MKTFAALFFLATPLVCLGQLHEKFDDNRNNWLFVKDNATSSINYGKYILETMQEGHGKFVEAPVYFDPNKDFTLEASYVQKSGSDNNGFGLFFGKASSSIYNEFVITSNGYYMIGAKGQGSNWVECSVNPLGETNILKIQKRGSTISYYLNGKKILSNEVSSLGFEAGLINYTNMVLEIDYFDLDQDNAIKLIENMPHGLVKENLGSAINSPIDDLSPIISADGKTLYFGRENYEGNLGGTDDGEDIWISTYDGKNWSQAVNFGSPVNDTEVNNLASVSADNNTLIFARRSKFDFRKKTETGWADPVDAGIFYTNESDHEEAQLAPDGKAMLFTIKNSSNIHYSSIDEKDIYVSIQDKDGTWSSPLNLGSMINTGGDETGPFLSSDGRTLYFSTNGRPGYGGFDMFVSKRIGDGWTNWSEPLNLGPEINSGGFDAYYTLPASGDYAYLVGDKDSYGKADIFRIKLPKAAKPDPVVLLSGRALNAKNKQPVSAEILLDNLENGKEVAEANSDPSTGSFKIILQPGANYGIHAAAKGYLSVNENIELAAIHEYTEMQKDLLLMPIEVGLTLPLNNVFFEQGKPTLRKESYPELDRLVKILVDNPNMHIELAGHTDNVGSGVALMKLSQDRVDMVKKYLVSNSISAARITGKGYGATFPREKNDTEEHRKMNRRVEFKILKN